LGTDTLKFYLSCHAVAHHLSPCVLVVRCRMAACAVAICRTSRCSARNLPTLGTTQRVRYVSRRAALEQAHSLFFCLHLCLCCVQLINGGHDAKLDPVPFFPNPNTGEYHSVTFLRPLCAPAACPSIMEYEPTRLAVPSTRETTEGASTNWASTAFWVAAQAVRHCLLSDLARRTRVLVSFAFFHFSLRLCLLVCMCVYVCMCACVRAILCPVWLVCICIADRQPSVVVLVEAQYG
jgi:hypothetical protein